MASVFDLASILSRDRYGNLMPNPPVVDVIAEIRCWLIPRSLRKLGCCRRLPGRIVRDLRWAEWNVRYRDDVRRLLARRSGMVGAMATRLSGSSDLYEHAGRAPFCSINFITSHDGYTMNDLVSYKEKHNEANGEGNRDGDNNNLSDNYGVEGPSRKKQVESLRQRQIKNMFSTLLLSQEFP